jgi:hypothetical protein
MPLSVPVKAMSTASREPPVVLPAVPGIAVWREKV